MNAKFVALNSMPLSGNKLSPKEYKAVTKQIEFELGAIAYHCQEVYLENPGRYTNSFHVPVYYHLPALKKIDIEAPYHALTNAGHISYVELDGDPTKNLAAFERVVRHMKEAGIGYGSINHPVDRDPICGYNGIINDTCPCCGRSEADGVPFERIRRITGYLVGTLDKWNDAKRAEERDRVKHEVDSNFGD